MVKYLAALTAVVAVGLGVDAAPVPPDREIKEKLVLAYAKVVSPVDGKPNHFEYDYLLDPTADEPKTLRQLRKDGRRVRPASKSLELSGTLGEGLLASRPVESCVVLGHDGKELLLEGDDQLHHEVTFSPDGRFFMRLGCGDFSAKIRCVNTGKEPRKRDLTLKIAEPDSVVSDGKRILYGAATWDANAKQTGAIVGVVNTDGSNEATLHKGDRNNCAHSHLVTFLRDGRAAYLVSDDLRGEIALIAHDFDKKKSIEVGRVKFPSKGDIAEAIDPDGSGFYCFRHRDVKNGDPVNEIVRYDFRSKISTVLKSGFDAPGAFTFRWVYVEDK